MRRVSRKLLAATLVLELCACGDKDDPNSRRPKVDVSVLVDLSETWHNAHADGLDQRILSAVGNAIVGASNDLPKPIAVRYHAIGAASLGREPICSVTYRPSVFALGPSSPGTLTDRTKFATYIADECPEMFLQTKVEPETEIAATIITASRALELTRKGVPKVFIILSDFKEESPTQYSFRGIDFSDTKFVLVYRTLDEDRRNPAAQNAKLREWQTRLTNLGGHVELVDENAVLSSPKDFEATLKASAS
jgi:hypothetical protein